MNRKLKVVFGVLIALLITAPVLVALAAPEQFELTSNLFVPNVSLVAVLLAVPALYLLRGPVDPR